MPVNPPDDRNPIFDVWFQQNQPDLAAGGVDTKSIKRAINHSYDELRTADYKGEQVDPGFEAKAWTPSQVNGAVITPRGNGAPDENGRHVFIQRDNPSNISHGEPADRISLNVRPSNELIDRLDKIMVEHPEIRAYKVSNPDESATRTDPVTIYFDKSPSPELEREITHAVAPFVRKDIGKMTGEKIADGVYKDFNPTEKQSFELAARARTIDPRFGEAVEGQLIEGKRHFSAGEYRNIEKMIDNYQQTEPQMLRQMQVNAIKETQAAVNAAQTDAPLPEHITDRIVQLKYDAAVKESQKSQGVESADAERHTSEASSLPRVQSGGNVEFSQEDKIRLHGMGARVDGPKPVISQSSVKAALREGRGAISSITRNDTAYVAENERSLKGLQQAFKQEGVATQLEKRPIGDGLSEYVLTAAKGYEEQFSRAGRESDTVRHAAASERGAVTPVTKSNATYVAPDERSLNGLRKAYAEHGIQTEVRKYPIGDGLSEYVLTAAKGQEEQFNRTARNPGGIPSGEETITRSGGIFSSENAEHAGHGVNGALGVFAGGGSLYEKVRSGALQKDIDAGGVTEAIGAAGAGADGANAVLGGATVLGRAATFLKGAEASGALNNVAKFGEFSEKFLGPVGVATAAVQTIHGIATKDGHETTQALGSFGGGILGGMGGAAAGGGVFSVITEPLGAMGGGWAGGKAADGLGGNWADEQLKKHAAVIDAITGRQDKAVQMATSMGYGDDAQKVTQMLQKGGKPDKGAISEVVSDVQHKGIHSDDVAKAAANVRQQLPPGAAEEVAAIMDQHQVHHHVRQNSAKHVDEAAGTLAKLSTPQNVALLNNALGKMGGVS